MDRPPAVIRLEMHLADESVTGRASDASGAAKEFVGWLGLVAAIDALLGATKRTEGDNDA